MKTFKHNVHVRAAILASMLGAALAMHTPSAAATEPVDINSADAKTLATTINGVGLKRAQAIIEHRNMHGPFDSVDALREVPGIGMKTVNDNKSKLTVR